jgi:phosphoserine phosphatase
MEASLDLAKEQLAEQDMPIALAEMLEHHGDVLQIEMPFGDPVVIRRVLAECFAPCDVLVAADEILVPHLLVSDMDSTIIGQECIDELADYAGIKREIAAITDRAMQGELDFAAALHERVALLAGLEEKAITDCLRDRIRPNPGAKPMVEALKAKGCRTVLVTGGFHHFADVIGRALSFDRVVANRLAIADGRLTGQLVGSISDAATKARVLKEETEQLGADAVTLALGDGANDAKMLAAATYGIAYHAKPAAEATANGSTKRGDLGSVLRLLGM